MNNTQISNLIDAINKANITVIVGPPGAGKTTLSEGLAKSFPEHVIVHSDDYMQFGFKESLYKMMDDIKKFKELGNSMIIEGIQTARLLRKGLELEIFHADLIIKFELEETELVRRYAIRETKPYPFATLKANETIYKEYIENEKNIPPILLIIE